MGGAEEAKPVLGTIPRTPFPDGFGKPKSQLLDIFARKQRLALAWFAVAVVSWIWAAVDRWHLLAEINHRRDITIIDSLGTYYVSPVVDIQHAKDLHAMQTKWACKALFERNPGGLDNPELFQQMFLRAAAEKAKAQWQKTQAEYKAKDLHQKVELGAPEILALRNGTFITAVEVQLIRTGSYKGTPINEVLWCRAKFKFLVNPDLSRNARFPTAVADYELEAINRSS